MSALKTHCLPDDWRHTLRSRLSVDSAPSSKRFSHVCDFGWLTFNLPPQLFARSSFCWYVELVNTLREALAHFAHAATITKDAWSVVDGLHVFYRDELKVRYRFQVGSRLTDVAYLLDKRQPYSARFHRAKEQLQRLQENQPGELGLTVIPVSLVVSPTQWIPTMLNELASLCNTHRPTKLSSDWFTYQIIDVQIDLQQTSLPDTAVLALTSFLQSDVPLTSLSLKIDETPWTQQDVTKLIKSIDRPSMTSLKIVVATSTHWYTVMKALSQTIHLQSVDIVVEIDKLLEMSNVTAIQSSIQELRWTSSEHWIPTQFREIKSLGLCCSHVSWESRLVSIGHRLVALEVFSQEGYDRAAIPLHIVLHACSQLVCLKFKDTKIDSVDALVDGYVSGCCRARSVILEGVDITHIDSVSRLAANLKDTNTPAAQTVLEFSWLPVFGNVPVHIVEKFADVLDNNPRLRLLELRCHRGPSTVARLLKHHLRPLLPYDHPLLAHSTSSIGPFHKLSHDTIGHVLTFLGIHETRRVHVHLGHTSDENTTMNTQDLPLTGFQLV